MLQEFDFKSSALSMVIIVFRAKFYHIENQLAQVSNSYILVQLYLPTSHHRAVVFSVEMLCRTERIQIGMCDRDRVQIGVCVQRVFPLILISFLSILSSVDFEFTNPNMIQPNWMKI